MFYSGTVGCFGVSGAEVLQSLHGNFETFSAVDEIGKNIGITIAIALGFKLLFSIVLYMKVNAVQGKIQPSGELKSELDASRQTAFQKVVANGNTPQIIDIVKQSATKPSSSNSRDIVNVEMRSTHAAGKDAHTVSDSVSVIKFHL